MIRLLVFEKSRRIDQAILEQEVEIGFNVLRMHQFDHLLGTTGKHIIQFRIRTRGIEKPYFVHRPFINIKGMKTRVPAWRQLRGKKDRPGSAAIIAQVNIGCRYREPLRKVYNRRIQHIAARRIEVTKPNRDRVLVFVASLKAIGTTAPTHTAAHLPDTTPTLPDQVALGKCIHGNKQEQEKQKICKSDYQNGDFCSVCSKVIAIGKIAAIGANF